MPSPTSSSESTPTEVAALADTIRGQLGRRPELFSEIVRTVPRGQYRTLLRAWGLLRARGELVVAEDGRYSRKEPAHE
jgi:hypothetical protein